MNIKHFVFFLLLLNKCTNQEINMNNKELVIIPKPISVEVTSGFIDLKHIDKIIPKKQY